MTSIDLKQRLEPTFKQVHITVIDRSILRQGRLMWAHSLLPSIEGTEVFMTVGTVVETLHIIVDPQEETETGSGGSYKLYISTASISWRHLLTGPQFPQLAATGWGPSVQTRTPHGSLPIQSTSEPHPKSNIHRVPPMTSHEWGLELAWLCS